VSIGEFIEARLAERESMAKRAAVDPTGAMEAHFEAEALHEEQDWTLYPERRTEYSRGQADALHWAATRIREQIKPLTLHDPMRELREIEAKRRLLALANDAYYEADHYAYHGIRAALAAINSDHPDYDPAWAPASR
jgi:hypothetical protein